MVSTSRGRFASVAFSRDGKSRPSLLSANSSNETSAAAVTPLTAALDRAFAVDIAPKFPIAVVVLRAGRAFHVTPASVHVAVVRNTCGPFAVVPVTSTLRLAPVMVSPAAGAGIRNFRYAVF